jgi:hypothetical protein
MKSGARTSRWAIYLNIPYQCSISFNRVDFHPVDVHYHNKGISIVGKYFKKINPEKCDQTKSLRETLKNIHPSLKEICGNITIPEDDGKMLISAIQSKKSLYGASDASLKNGRATHAWIISSGNINDIEHPLMHISGSGSVHGATHYLSLSRGELQGITALTIIAKVIMEYFSSRIPSTFVCDNTGVIKRASQGNISSLKSQRAVNIDLYLTHKELKKDMDIKLEWIKGHSDEKGWSTIQDLENQRLSRDQIYNVWCDHMAEVQ